jgi:four helix bundle protein
VKIERFEDVQGWQAGRVLARMVYEATNKGDFARDFKLRDQIRDAAVSVMANIAEGFDAGSYAEFLRFLGYSRRSASEVQSHLYIALDQGYIIQKEFDAIYDRAVETKRLVGGFIRYLKSPKSKSLSPRSKSLKS